MDAVFGDSLAIKRPVIIASYGKSSSAVDSGEENSMEELEERSSNEVPLSDIITSTLVQVSGSFF